MAEKNCGIAGTFEFGLNEPTEPEQRQGNDVSLFDGDAAIQCDAPQGVPVDLDIIGLDLLGQLSDVDLALVLALSTHIG